MPQPLWSSPFGFSKEVLLLGEIAELCFLAETNNVELENEAYKRVSDGQKKLREQIDKVVQEIFGRNFQVADMFVRPGSIEIIVILGTVGAVYYAISRYKNLIECIQLLYTQVANIIHRFLRDYNLNNLSMGGTWRPGLAFPEEEFSQPSRWMPDRLIIEYLFIYNKRGQSLT